MLRIKNFFKSIFSSHPEALADMPPGLKNLVAEYLGMEATRFAQSSPENFSASLPTLLQLRQTNPFRLVAGCLHIAAYRHDSLFMYGMNDSGQLGLGHTKTLDGFGFIRVDLAALGIRPGELSQVFLGLYHSALVTYGGELWVSGRNSGGQLCLGDTQDRQRFERVDLAALGIQPRQLSQVIIGPSSHNALITCDGQLWIGGLNDYGQLGLNDTKNQNRFVKVDLAALGIQLGELSQVVLGAGDTALITCDGRLLRCGYNGEGGLGLGDRIHRDHFVEIDLKALGIQPGELARVVLGVTSSALVTRVGSLWVCGANAKGQLSLGDTQPRDRFTKIDLVALGIQPGELSQVILEAFNSALVTHTGRLFICGSNERGQLGLGDTNNRNRFVEVDLAALGIQPGELSQVVLAPAQVTFLVMRDGRIWGCGNNLLMLSEFRDGNSDITTTFKPLKNLPWLKEESWISYNKIIEKAHTMNQKARVSELNSTALNPEQQRFQQAKQALHKRSEFNKALQDEKQHVVLPNLFESYCALETDPFRKLGLWLYLPNIQPAAAALSKPTTTPAAATTAPVALDEPPPRFNINACLVACEKIGSQDITQQALLALAHFRHDEKAGISKMKALLQQDLAKLPADLKGLLDKCLALTQNNELASLRRAPADVVAATKCGLYATPLASTAVATTAAATEPLRTRDKSLDGSESFVAPPLRVIAG